MDKKIKFIAASDMTYENDTPPIPASQGIPDWYRESPATTYEGDIKFGRDMSTLKACTPFLDSLTAGYFLTAPDDIHVSTKADGEKNLSYVVPTNNDFAREREGRTGYLPVPAGYHQHIWRASLYPCVETPEGYSTLFIHPMNRFELPFLAISAIVDTDKPLPPVAVSFYLREDFEGVILKGTPMLQAIPFKRDNWKSEVKAPYSTKISEEIGRALVNDEKRNYLKKFWHKKTYR